MNEHLHFGLGHHMRSALTVRGLRKEVARADGLNAKIAVAITGWVSTMWCAYAFGLIALLSLPAIMTSAFHWHIFPHWIVNASLIALVAWVSSYFLQLVLLSILSVQQSVEGAKNAVAQAHLASQIDLAVDRLDTSTQGGITAILERLDQLDPKWHAITAADILEAKKKRPPSTRGY